MAASTGLGKHDAGTNAHMDPAQTLFMSLAAFEARERVVSAALSAAAKADFVVEEASSRVEFAQAAVQAAHAASVAARVSAPQVEDASGASVEHLASTLDAYNAAVAALGDALKKQAESGQAHATAHLLASSCHRADQGPHGAVIGSIPTDRFVYTCVRDTVTWPSLHTLSSLDVYDVHSSTSTQ